MLIQPTLDTLNQLKLHGTATALCEQMTQTSAQSLLVFALAKPLTPIEFKVRYHFTHQGAARHLSKVPWASHWAKRAHDSKEGFIS